MDIGIECTESMILLIKDRNLWFRNIHRDFHPCFGYRLVRIVRDFPTRRRLLTSVL